MAEDSKTILIVEDSFTHLVLMKGLISNALKGTGVSANIKSAKTFEEAVDTLNDASTNVSAILLDNGFPMGGERLGSAREGGAEGMQLLGMIRANQFEPLDPEVPVAWNTATINESKIQQVQAQDEANHIPAGRTTILEKGEAAKVIPNFIRNALGIVEGAETEQSPKSWGERTTDENQGPSGSSGGPNPF